MFYLVDIGNTRIKVALGAADGSIQEIWYFPSDAGNLGKKLQEKLASKKAETALVASVVPSLTEILIKTFQALGISSRQVKRELKWGFSLGVENKDSIGQDRLLNMEAACSSTLPVLVIDLGTVTKFDFLIANPAREFAGGAIGPGFSSSYEALLKNTSQLKEVDFTEWPNVIGKNTSEAIRSGYLHGFLAMMEGMRAKFCQEKGISGCETWLTGGATLFFTAHLPEGWECRTNLTLQGMISYAKRNGVFL